MEPTVAERFVHEAPFYWHQRFELVPGVYTPGINDIERLLTIAEFPADLSGLSVLDIGTANGGVCWAAEARGATRIVGADVGTSSSLGFAEIREFIGSSAEYLQASVYELPELLDGEQFDIVVFFGVLYHLRHPLLALDIVRTLARSEIFIETAVYDYALQKRDAALPLVRFYPGDQLNGDGTNWFSPTTRALLDWCETSGLDSTLLSVWPPPFGRTRWREAVHRLRTQEWMTRRRGPRDPRRNWEYFAGRAMVRAKPVVGEPSFARSSPVEELIPTPRRLPG